MNLSRVQKISILLGLNAAFFVVELTVGEFIRLLYFATMNTAPPGYHRCITYVNHWRFMLCLGYIIGSLALIADAYHMLSDVLGLVIALYAIKVSTENPLPCSTQWLLDPSIKLSNRSADSKYSYGWHRAEVVAALANGMFLIALCFSIFMESLERFVHPPGLVMICLPLNSTDWSHL